MEWHKIALNTTNGLRGVRKHVHLWTFVCKISTHCAAPSLRRLSLLSNNRTSGEERAQVRHWIFYQTLFFMHFIFNCTSASVTLTESLR